MNSDTLSSVRPRVAPRRQVRLTGPAPPIDPRSMAARRDLADIALADQVFAQHYAEPVVMHATLDTKLHDAPADDARCVAALAVGDAFAVFELGERWSWGRCRDGGCVGYVDTAALALDTAAALAADQAIS